MPTFPVGVVLFPPPVQPVLRAIRLAEQVGLPMAWVPSWPVGPDAVSVVTAAAVQTSRIGLGTGITITSPRHPLTLVNEALVMAELAPQRFRLGIGVSHQPTIEGVYGLDFAHPLARVREYIAVLRGLLWEGRVACQGTYYRVHAALPARTAPPQVPIILAALRPPLLRLAGEVADGALLIWATLSYVRTIALPALEAGARRAQRRRPPLIVSAPIVRTTDFALVQQRAQEAWAVYAALPAYQRMFHAGGYPLTPDGRLTEELIHELFLYGDEETIRQRLAALRAAGVDELVTPLSPGREAESDQRALMELLASL
jgi:alkanesulfonate monooxygenase SsuD/methylene tetrahydromethanopterin reductase-like flavin-dependent oxidoreductase (luciferase family)